MGFNLEKRKFRESIGTNAVLKAITAARGNKGEVEMKLEAKSKLEISVDESDPMPCTWNDFTFANEDMSPEEAAEIRQSLEQTGTARCGGGAAPIFDIKLI
jgi:hypothetical protein